MAAEGWAPVDTGAQHGSYGDGKASQRGIGAVACVREEQTMEQDPWLWGALRDQDVDADDPAVRAAARDDGDP